MTLGPCGLHKRLPCGKGRRLKMLPSTDRFHVLFLLLKARSKHGRYTVSSFFLFQEITFVIHKRLFVVCTTRHFQNYVFRLCPTSVRATSSTVCQVKVAWDSVFLIKSLCERYHDSW